MRPLAILAAPPGGDIGQRQVLAIQLPGDAGQEGEQRARLQDAGADRVDDRGGAAPDDGFTEYPPFSNGVGRWGDYSAAVAVVDDSVWMATEYISTKKRDQFTNWSTFIGMLPLADID